MNADGHVNARSLDAPDATSPWSSFGEFFETAKCQPIFVILGVQGAGTNLLRSILSGAFNCSVVQDQSIVFNTALRVGTNPSAQSLERAFQIIESRLFPSSLTRKTQRRIKSNGSFEGIQQQFALASIKSGAELALFVYAYTAFSRGTTMMAIKSDDLWENIDHLNTVLPNRRVILLTRDFRDNLLSITKKDFGPIDPIVAARYVKDRFAIYDAEYQRTPDAYRIHVRYEELLAAPDVFVARFREKFGLAVLGKSPTPVDTTRIRRDNMRKWASLSPRQLGYCEGILWQQLRTYGYGTESAQAAPPGPLPWRIAQLRDALARVPQKFRNASKRLSR